MATEMDGAAVSLLVVSVACVAGLPAKSLTSAVMVSVPSPREEIEAGDGIAVGVDGGGGVDGSAASRGGMLMETVCPSGMPEVEPKMATKESSAALRKPSPPSLMATEMLGAEVSMTISELQQNLSCRLHR